MKKSLCLVLAASMIAGTAATAFATDATADYKLVPVLFVKDDDGTFVPTTTDRVMAEYGKTYAIPIITELSKSDMNKYKAYAEWDLGSDAISDLKLDYSKFDFSSFDTSPYATVVANGGKVYTHAIQFSTKTSTSTTIKDISGKVTIAKTSTAAKNEFAATNGNYIEIAGELSNEGVWYKYGTENQENVFDNDVMDLEFNDGEVIFTVDTKGQSNLNLAMNTKFNAEVSTLYPEANLEFYTWTASPVFNRTGTLSFYVENTDENPAYLYEITPNGIKETNAEYDEELEAFTLKTRKLSKYVVSDVELDEIDDEIKDTETPKPEVPTTKPNPSTGR